MEWLINYYFHSERTYQHPLNHHAASSIVLPSPFPSSSGLRRQNGRAKVELVEKTKRSVEQLPAYRASFCSVCIAIGMSKFSKAKIARLTAISFGLLWIVMLGPYYAERKVNCRLQRQIKCQGRSYHQSHDEEERNRQPVAFHDPILLVVRPPRWAETNLIRALLSKRRYQVPPAKK
jgi:hypothetical protein